jgi:hypothetical protein
MVVRDSRGAVRMRIVRRSSERLVVVLERPGSDA